MDLSELTPAHIDWDGTKRVCYFRQNSSDKKVLDQILKGGAYDLSRLPQFLDIQEAIREQSSKGKAPFIIDAGANIGISAMFFAITFLGSVIYAIEPEESNYRLLIENTKGLNVICVQAALSDKPGRVNIVDNGLGHWGFQTEDAEEQEGSIPAITMESIIHEEIRKDRWLMMAKIDIEGTESAIFEGQPSWVREVPILIVELHDWLFPKGGTSRSFMKCMADEERDIIPLGENILAIKHKLV